MPFSALNFSSLLRRLRAPFVMVSLVLMLMSGGAEAQTATRLGQHVVQRGETLYCIGRAYGVRPQAIALASGVNMSALLHPGQIVNIPAEQWLRILPGPVCVAQFVSPYVRVIATTAPPANLPPAPSTTSILGYHIVRGGETLYCIGRAYGVLPSAIAQTNQLSAAGSLSVGQTLAIPAVRWVPVPPGLVCQAQFVSPYVGLPPAATSAPQATRVPAATNTPTRVNNPPPNTATPTSTLPPTKTPDLPTPTNTPPITKTPSP